MKKKVNIKGNIFNDITITKLKNMIVANFILSKKYGKAKEHIMCNLYFEEKDVDSIRYLKQFKKDDYIHLFGHFETIEKNGKTYKNFIINNLNKVA